MNLKRKFQKKFSKKYGLMVNSGSSAIMLAIHVLNLKKNNEVITPCLNFGTAVSSLMHFGIKPIFVDIDLETLQIDIDQIEKKISKNTKAIMVPNLIGNIPDWKEIFLIAKKYKLKIIEDSADTLGAKIDNKSTGFLVIFQSLVFMVHMLLVAQVMVEFCLLIIKKILWESKSFKKLGKVVNTNKRLWKYQKKTKCEIRRHWLR